MLTLFPDEQIVSQSNNNEITLTTHRIIKSSSNYNQSIMLEHITSCENKYTDNKIWILLGAIIIIVTRGQEIMYFGLIPILIYFLKRKNQIFIASPSTKIEINVIGMKKEKILSFINSIEQTKHQRLLYTNKN